MNFKNSKKIKVSALAGIISIGLLTGSYSILKKDVTLVVKGEETTVSTFKNNVKDLLEEQNIKYDSNDIVSKPLDAKLTDRMNIEVIDVTVDTIKETKQVDFEVQFVEDSNLEKGTTKIQQEGITGANELIYTVTYHNGKQVDKQFVEELVSVEPKSKIVRKGTKVEVQVASSRGESSRGVISKVNATTTSTNSISSKGRHMKVVATAYSGDTITSTGTTPKWGTIAVDPSVIPYGTKVYIPQFDMTFVAEDTGSAIRGNKIDIFMPDSSKVDSWGRKTIDIYIVG